MRCAQCGCEIKASEAWVKIYPQADDSAGKEEPIYLHMIGCIDVYVDLCSQTEPEKEYGNVQKG